MAGAGPGVQIRVLFLLLLMAGLHHSRSHRQAFAHADLSPALHCCSDVTPWDVFLSPCAPFPGTPGTGRCFACLRPRRGSVQAGTVPLSAVAQELPPGSLWALTNVEFLLPLLRGHDCP